MDERIRDKIRSLREQYGIPTAKKGVLLFQPGGDESYVAIVYPSNDIRALGFKMAADKLVDMVMTEPDCADYLVYSVGYLYRMYIELRLKDIIEMAGHVPGKVHDLDRLWNEARPIMESSSQWFDDQELEAVEEEIQEFSRIDPFSDAWRYSKNTKREPTLKDISAVDLRHLRQVVDSISTALDGSHTAVLEDRERNE